MKFSFLRHEFDKCVDLLTRKIEDLAAKAGVPDAVCIDLQSTLGALPQHCREHVSIMLQGIAVQAEYESPTMAFAARYVLNLAREIWETAPVPSRGVCWASDGSGSSPLFAWR